MIARKFKKRIKEYKRKEMKTLVKVDQDAWKDPQNLSEFSNEIYKCLLVQEEVQRITPADYLKTVQTEVRDT